MSWRPGVDWRAARWGAGWVLLLAFGASGSLTPHGLRWLHTLALAACVLFYPAAYFGGFAGLALLGRLIGNAGYPIGALTAVFVQGFALARYIRASRGLDAPRDP